MEIFIEEMVKKKKTAVDYVKAMAIFVLTVILIFAAFVLMYIFPVFNTIILFIVVGLVYGAYKLATSINVEYEYSLVNTEIDVDKIVNKRKRKRLTTAPIRGLVSFGTKKNPEYDRYIGNSVINNIYACVDKNAEDIFYMVYNQGDKKNMLIFNPSERIIEQIAKNNPRIPIV